MNDKKEFFISYSQNDEEWAMWIDETLKNAGHTTILQACDQGMEIDVDSALRNSECFIAVISNEYQDSPYCRAAWTAAIGKEIGFEKNTFISDEPIKPLFIPAKITDVKLEGLWAKRNYISLYRCDKNSQEAKELLLDAIKPRPFNRPVELIKKPDFAEKKDIIKNLPFVRNLYFTGREKILEEISQKLKSNGMVSLIQSSNDLLGVGKTEIALEYTYIHEKEYETILWMNAENKNNLLVAIRDLMLYKQTISEKAEENDIIESIKNWFNNNEKWLFIYDNVKADDFNKWLEPFLPQRLDGKGHILITTQNTFFPKCKSLITVPVFNEIEAVSFLKIRTDKSGEEYSDAFAKMLAEQLQYLPLALEQAAEYIRKTPGVTYQDCIALIKSYGANVFNKK